MTLIKWHGSENPAEGALVETANFNDGSVGDAATYETGQDEQDGSPCQIRSGNAWITGVWDFEGVVPLGAYSFTYHLTESDAAVPCSAPDPPTPDPPVKQYFLEIADAYSTDPGDWTVVASGALLADSGTLTGSIGATGRYVRLRVNYELDTYDANGFGGPTKYTYARISDFRITGEEACAIPDLPTLIAESSIVDGVPRITLYGNQ